MPMVLLLLAQAKGLRGPLHLAHWTPIWHALPSCLPRSWLPALPRRPGSDISRFSPGPS